MKLQDARIRPAGEEGQERLQCSVRNRKGFGGLVGWWIGGLESESGRRLTGWPLQSGLPINVAEIRGLSSTVPPACVRTVGAGCFCVCFLPCNLEKSATVTSLIA